jgi:hypothetical protein
LVTGRKMICVTPRGGDYSTEPFKSFDFVENYLRIIFGFVGITDKRFFMCSRWTSRWTSAGRHSEPRSARSASTRRAAKGVCGSDAEAPLPGLTGVKPARMAVA